MTSNRLQLSYAKTEVLWCASARRQHQIPTSPVRNGNTTVLSVTAVRDLGVYLNSDVSVATSRQLSEHVLQHRLQSVFNAVAQLVFSDRRFEHVTLLLRDLH